LRVFPRSARLFHAAKVFAERIFTSRRFAAPASFSCRLVKRFVVCRSVHLACRAPTRFRLCYVCRVCRCRLPLRFTPSAAADAAASLMLPPRAAEVMKPVFPPKTRPPVARRLPTCVARHSVPKILPPSSCRLHNKKMCSCVSLPARFVFRVSPMLRSSRFHQVTTKPAPARRPLCSHRCCPSISRTATCSVACSDMCCRRSHFASPAVSPAFHAVVSRSSCSFLRRACSVARQRSICHRYRDSALCRCLTSGLPSRFRL